MVTALPTPIEFRLPDGWRAVSPDEAGAPDAAFVALHPNPDHGFTANITVAGELSGTETLTQVADRALDTLRHSDVAVRMSDREAIGSAAAPGITQVVRLSAPVHGVTRELAQAQVYLSLLDTGNPDRRGLLRLVLTATAAQFDAVLADFRYFVWTVQTDTAGC